MKLRNSVLLLSLLVIYTLPGKVCAQIDWELYDNNPVFDGSHDSEPYEIYQPMVLIGDTFHMWYTRKIANGDYENIGYATSPDGLEWTMVNPAVLNPSDDPERFDSDNVGQGTVLWDEGIFKMWYWGDGPNIGNIGYATSGDGIDWTKVDGSGMDQSVYDRDMDGTGSLALTTPRVVRIDGTYHMWYSRVHYEEAVFYRIGYATSPDGLNWTYVPGPGTDGALLEPGEAGSFDESSVFYPLVVVNDGEFQMWYAGWDDEFVVRTGYAVSNDGVNWSRVVGNGTAGACLDDGATGTVIRDGDSYRYWFSSGDMELSLAVSGDQQGISAGSNPLIPGGIELHQNYPNPFNPTTQIEFTISHSQEVQLSVYNIMGQHIEVLAGGCYSAGVHQVQFDGSKLTNGVYVCRLVAGEQVNTVKMLLVK
jgi:predicted GH43/DUF377 family glycosyl hydrolase